MGIWIAEEVENVPDHVKTLCETIFLENGYDNCEVTVSPACPKGENYFSNVLRLTAKRDDEEFSLITKMALSQEYFRIISFAPHVFYNESAVYLHLFPKFDDIQNEANISGDDRFRYAKIYASADKPTEVIILEDLNPKGYSNLEKNVDYENAEILLALKEIAKFHALSFALKNKDENCYTEIKDKLLNFWGLEYNISALMSLYRTIQEGTSYYFDDERQKQYLKESILGLPELGQRLYDQHVESRYSVISMGLKYKNKPMYHIKDGKPNKIIMLDFQQSTASTPAVDVHFYICNSTEYENRSEHYKGWLEYYYEQLGYFLRKFDLYVEEVYTKKEFEEDSKIASKFVFGISVLLASYIAREAEIQVQTGKNNDNPAEKYKKTVYGLMNSMLEMGYVH